MKLLNQIFIVFCICFVGDIISYLLPIPFPGSVIAMVLLFILLCTGAVRKRRIEAITDFLLKNMSLMFIPPTVSIIGYLDVLGEVFVPFVLICLITTVLTFLATAYSVKLVIFLINRNKNGEEKIL
mgnify:FL=1